MDRPHLSDTERAVLDVIDAKGAADQHDVLNVLDPDLGMFYLADVLETLYAFDLIREVDVGKFELHSVAIAA